MFRPDQVNTLPVHRVVILQLAVVCLFVTVLLRLWYFQIYKGEQYAQKAKANITRQQSVHAPRGLIRDRHGIILADNRPAYGLAVIRENCPDIHTLLSKVSSWAGVPLDTLTKRFQRGRTKVLAFKPQLLIPNLSFKQLAYIEARIDKWPSLSIITRPLRTYPYGKPLSHVLGYVAQANEQELRSNSRLALGDMIGKQGVEKSFEDRLHGHKGLKHLEVNAQGRTLRSHIVRPPVPGANISLSLDLELQQFIWDTLGEDTGGVVVMDPSTGHILALVSKPGYDNNLFVQGLDPKTWKDLTHDPNHPLQNRVIQSSYPPGSVFKLAVASCALAESDVTPQTTYYCPGRYRLGRGVFRCWKSQGHGKLRLKEAIAQSCDVYFYNLGERLGIEKISDFAHRAGFGQQTGIRLPNESPGLIPDKAWKLRRFGRPWQGGETVITAIGQGYTLTTPIQVARFISALVNGGRLLRPELMLTAPPDEQGLLPMTGKDRTCITQAMIRAVRGRHGTARRLRLKDITVGAKTGTAQVVRLSDELKDKDMDEIPYKFRDHAWMASFASTQATSYVVVAVIEHGGHGGSAAGPVVRAVYEHLFGLSS